MRSYILSLGVATLGASMMIGCSSPNEFTPAAQPTNLAAYAASNQYPANTTAKDNPHLTAVINHTTGQITVRNFDNGPVANFKLWVNQTYVVHVDRIEPNSSRVFNRADLFNSAGNNMENTSVDAIHKVQIETANGELWNVQGPQME